jgi:5-(carboxyamino)imidazole ribonucleotide synthase
VSHEPKIKVAIIGGGQLGYMLCEAAHQLNLEIVIVTADAQAPALRIADYSIISPLTSPGLGARIAAAADAVTFEFEAVPDELLMELEQHLDTVSVRPAPAVLRLLKNKARQKAWLVDHNFPTLRYQEVSAAMVNDRVWLQDIPLPFVQKAQEGGYDGYGVQIIRAEEQLDSLWPVPSIVEPCLEGVRELAVVAARSSAGQCIAYPPVELCFDPHKNILDYVVAPAALPERVNAQAMNIARSIIEQLQGVGVFAVELFLTQDDELLVNEISPRVHNSGHHTLEACVTSQFEQHMRAVAGMPLASAEQLIPCVMKNILFEDSLAELLHLGPGRIPSSNDSIWVHWYGKTSARPGRKMGHITCIGPDTTAAREQVSETLAGLTSSKGS